MFERYNDDARRSLFFARYKTTERDGDEITDEDLLHGISLGAPAAMELLGDKPAATFRSAESGEQFLARVERNGEAWITRSSREIPFSVATKRALESATTEADALSPNYVGPEHLLLGLLRDETTNAWRLLHEAGARLTDLRLRVAERQKGGPAA